MTIETTLDACSFCQTEGRIVPAVVSLRLEFALLPDRWLSHEGLLVRDDATRACAAHIESLARVGKVAIDSATVRVRRVLDEAPKPGV